MKTTLQWRIFGQEFEDGSQLTDWEKVESSAWHPQIDRGYQMTFAIYEHDGQFWKLYQGRWAVEGTTEYLYRYGGQACRMTQVAYKTKARSPHSGLLKEAGDLEWVRVYEVDEQIHTILQAGQLDSKYDGKTVAA
ncbi:MAG: hypothetical protein F6K19_24570 [Cyanothece sp. SIO1E1]|nr:hypothetical protein [Cyanothece sp. SIO1E1]